MFEWSPFRLWILTCLLISPGWAAQDAAADVSPPVCQELQLALDSPFPAQSVKNRSHVNVFEDLFRRAQQDEALMPWIVGVEVDGAERKNPVTLDIPAGTLRSQLDFACQATGYKWIARGNAVNFVPRAKADDTSYIMNQRIPGIVVVSRDPSLETNVSEWFKQHRISSARLIKRLELNLPKPEVSQQPPPLLADPAVLDNPTLREYSTARDAIYDNWFFILTVHTVPPADASEVPIVSLIKSSVKR